LTGMVVPSRVGCRRVIVRGRFCGGPGNEEAVGVLPNAPTRAHRMESAGGQRRRSPLCPRLTIASDRRPVRSFTNSPPLEPRARTVVQSRPLGKAGADPGGSHTRGTPRCVAVARTAASCSPPATAVVAGTLAAARQRPPRRARTRHLSADYADRPTRRRPVPYEGTDGRVCPLRGAVRGLSAPGTGTSSSNVRSPSALLRCRRRRCTWRPGPGDAQQLQLGVRNGDTGVSIRAEAARSRSSTPRPARCRACRTSRRRMRRPCRRPKAARARERRRHPPAARSRLLTREMVLHRRHPCGGSPDDHRSCDATRGAVQTAAQRSSGLAGRLVN